MHIPPVGRLWVSFFFTCWLSKRATGIMGSESWVLCIVSRYDMDFNRLLGRYGEL